MIVDTDVKASADEIWKRFGYLWKFLDVDRKRAEISELESKMAAPGFWDDHAAAQSVISELTRLKNLVNPLTALKKRSDDLAALFEYMADGHLQCFGGARLVLDGNKVDTLLVGGAPVDPDKTYGVATIDFLLDGGDRINIGKNAQELIITDVKVIDSMLPYAMSYAERGDTIRYFVDDRLVIRGRE